MLLTTNVKTITISYTIKSIVRFIIFEKLFPLFVTRVFLPFSFPMAMNLFHLWTIERNVHLCTFYYHLYYLGEFSAHRHVFLCPRLNSNYFDCINRCRSNRQILLIIICWPRLTSLEESTWHHNYRIHVDTSYNKIKNHSI